MVWAACRGVACVIVFKDVCCAEGSFTCESSQTKGSMRQRRQTTALMWQQIRTLSYLDTITIDFPPLMPPVHLYQLKALV